MTTELISCGVDRGRGNLLGIQPLMALRDYATEERFRSKIAGYLEVARRAGALRSNSVVVLPEYIGTWLVAAGEPAALYRARSLERAMALLALRHAPSFARALLGSRARDRVRSALFRVKAPAMAATYQRVFAGLARQYGLTLVAGSIVLPGPAVAGGALAAGDGELLNVSAVFYSDGSADERLVRKRFPIDAELPFIAAAPRAEPPLFDTPAGRLAVLICADAFYPESYAALQGRGVEMLAVPSYLQPAGVWQKPWAGYNGAASPPDVDPRDPGAISEREAWLKYGMAGRMAHAGIPYGLNVFLRGEIVDLGSDGATIMARPGELVEVPQLASAALANLWL